MVLLVLRGRLRPELATAAFDNAKDDHEGVLESLDTILADRGEQRQLDVKLPGGRFMTEAESELPILAEAIVRRDESSKVNRLSSLSVGQPATLVHLLSLITALGQSTKLAVLEFDRTNLGSVAPSFILEALRSIPSLRTLRLIACKLGQTHVSQLAACFDSGEAANLAELSLARNSLPELAMHPLLLALASTTQALQLRTLDLSDNGLSRAALALLCNVLRAARIPLSRLDLSGCAIPLESINLLEAAMLSPHLQQLNFDNCALSDEHFCSMSEHLATNTTLTDISLSGNGCSPVGSKALASALARNLSLRRLALSHTKIGASFYEDWMPLLSSPTCRLGAFHSTNADILPREGTEWIANLSANGSLVNLDINPSLLMADCSFALKEIAKVTSRNMYNQHQLSLTLFDHACTALSPSDVGHLTRLSTPLCQRIAASLVVQNKWKAAFEERSFSIQFGI